MALSASPEVKRLFPLTSLDDVLQLFRKQLQLPDPDLTLLSIVTGYIESTLISRFNESQAAADDSLSHFPVVEWSFVEELYDKFQTILATIEIPATKGGKSKQISPPVATRDVIKRVSDLIWNSLIRSTYKDRAHLQSLYSYLASSKLDCFGVAFAVVAGCQLLGYTDVNLAISEDHAWVVFGPSHQQQTIEVTWHGKGFEDKRGEPVSSGVESQSWLYLSGHPVVCDRGMEVSALVLAINPSLNITSACLEVTEMQQKLLWLLYDHGHLERYPMGLGNLGELEEFAATEKRPSSEELYRQSVVAARRWHKNYHVYPYTYQGSYFYRKVMYKEAFAAWADAGDVIRRYIYSRDDEEIYKELLDIANEQIPIIMKESSGHSAKSILRDPKCFANLLRFYDGICKWEEGSLTPILHIGWAKPLVSTIGKFDYSIRSQVIIETADDDEAFPDTTEENSPPTGADKEANNNSMKTTNNNAGDFPPSMAQLTAGCGEQILNPNFLTGGELQPFKTTTATEGHRQKAEVKVATAAVEVTVKVEAVVDRRVEEDPLEPKSPEIKLFSQKMKGLKNLLLAEKLNTQAILLQVTAQSQVGGGKKNSRSGGGANNWNESGGSATNSGARETNNQNRATGGGAGGGGGNTGSAFAGSEAEEVTGSGRPKRARRE